MLYDAAKPVLRIKNHLLSTLGADEFQFIKPHLDPVSLENGRMLADLYDPICHCFFPNNGMISLLSVTESGDTCEVGYIGHEGVVGLPAIFSRNEMPYQLLVQATSEGYRVPVPIVAELFARGGDFHDDALRFAYVLLRQFAQTSACNRFHDIQSRLCRWFVIMCERSGDSNLALTQEFLAYMLGVQRTSVSTIANSLQDSGIIKYRRGKVEVRDLDRLRSLSCECYSVINEELATFLAEKNTAHKSTTRQTRTR